ncbi:MAG TPA: hypothetical protein VK540_06590 [Polyangiaceae bacterium]|jgi:hypothetical protein|nr:hypothetical protein [Polyangiaceae bacterium]
MTKIQLYRDERGGWSFYAAEGRPVEAELSDGYRLGERLDGQLCIMGAPVELAMRASEAVRLGVVKIPMFWPIYRRVEA